MAVKNAKVAHDDLPDGGGAVLWNEGTGFRIRLQAFNLLSNIKCERSRVGLGIAGDVLDDFLEVLSGPLGPDYFSH